MCVLDMKVPPGFDLFCIFKNYHVLAEIYREAVIENAVKHGKIARNIIEYLQIQSLLLYHRLQG